MDLAAPALPGEYRRRSDLVPATGTPACAAAPSPQPSSSTGSPSSAPAPDPVFTPRSSSSSTRPKVPGNAVVPDPGAHRFSGNDRVATSVDTSQQLFPKAGSVPVVVISSASSYADSAGGARYAAEKGGSLLLTPGSKLDPAVEAEVRRSLAAGGSIVVTGREDAISPSVFSALEKIAPGRTERVGGVDRFETATKLAQRLSDEMTTTATGPIYLVTGADYPDALVVVSLARRTGGLIVLSKDGVLPPVTRTLLQQMDPTGARTVPVGGAAALAAASLGGDAGRTAAAAAVVGSDRYETARRVAERFVALDAAAGARTDVVGLATGTTWPDALVGSTAMGTLVGPLLLNHGDQLDPNVVKALAAIPSSRPSSTVVFGGEAAVPASVMAAFGAAAKG
nr:cell wall-binding repeat-containing protein [Quadrisphaera sp. RL12-1S]